MESDASWEMDGCGCCALSNSEGLSCLHRMYVMRTRDARATLYQDKGSEEEYDVRCWLGKWSSMVYCGV
jgi:hypothetical protein